jgi:hypothetical protein
MREAIAGREDASSQYCISHFRVSREADEDDFWWAEESEGEDAESDSACDDHLASVGAREESLPEFFRGSDVEGLDDGVSAGEAELSSVGVSADD